MVEVSEMDVEFLAAIRANVSRFLAKCGRDYDHEGWALDIAPQDHEGAVPHFSLAKIETLDINPAANCTYRGDICQLNAAIPSGRFDIVICTEVLEHVLQPFDAVNEIARILKPGGYLFASAPFNFRIHGPLPDCWRFSEHGWRALLSDFEILELAALEAPARNLAPIHYTVVARRPSV